MQAQAGKFWAMGALAAMGLAYGLLLYVESALAPAGCCFATWPQPNPFQAERLMLRADPLGLTADAQRAEALTVLRARPADVEAWLRLAFADRLQHATLTSEGQKALDASYSVTPYAADRADWRVIFILDNWDQTPQRTRTDAMNEIAIIKADPVLRDRLRTRTPGIRNQNGRIIAALLGVLPVQLPKT